MDPFLQKHILESTGSTIDWSSVGTGNGGKPERRDADEKFPCGRVEKREKGIGVELISLNGTRDGGACELSR